MGVNRKKMSNAGKLLLSQLFSSPNKKTWKTPPHINQLRPKGAEAGYANGAYNCGPTVVAMLARAWGRMGNMSDAELIETLASRVTTQNGTTPSEMMKMLSRANIPLGGDALGAGFSHQALGRRLQSGQQFIAQVGTKDPKTGKVSSHYVLIREQRRDGSYLISDPLSNKPQVVTKEQLKEAVMRAPPDGGVLMPIANPMELDGGDPDSPRRGSSRGGRSSSRFSSFGSRFSDFGSMFKAGKGAQAATEAPDATAFHCSDDVFHNVDTRFRHVDRLQHRPDLNEAFEVVERMGGQQSLRVSYTDGDYFSVRGKQKHALTPAHLTVGEFAHQLRQARAQGDAQTYELLRQLSTSRHQKDKEVLAAIEAQDLRDPGIGKKTTTEF